MRLRSMRWVAALLIGMAALAAVVLPGGPAARAAISDEAVFVQTNDAAGNAIAAFHRRADGSLSFAATYPTEGKGGRESGATSDPLASQGSLVLDRADGLLFAVNAGSNTITVFDVHGARLRLRQVVASGGSFPVGFALRGSLLYVLNAGLAGTVSGFRIANGRVRPINGSTRSLGLSNASPPFFLSSPAEAGFTPSGSQLVVATKTNGTVDVFSVDQNGMLSGQPVKNAVSGVPFAFRFDAAGDLVLVNAATTTAGAPNPGTGSVATYAVNPDGTVATIHAPVANGQSASCWLATIGRFDYVANTGSGTISQYRVSNSGNVTLVNPTAASGIAGATDLAAAGGFLYAQAGLASEVEVYAVGRGGALTLIQTRSVPDGASQEGIVAV